MYSNIPLEEGLAAFKECLDKRSDKSIPTDYIMKLLRLIMTKNIFTFNEETWLQLLGTCMGTRVSPSYANLFMAVLENKMIDNCPAHLKEFIYLWRRFIDDILIFWSGSWQQFLEFFNYLNQFHNTIKFDDPCHNPTENSCNFLDLKISIVDGIIHTDLFRKPTDKPRALLPSSAHPNHISTNIIYGAAFRLLRICDSENIFETRLSELKNNFLIPRNYNSKLIESQFKKVRELPGNNYSDRRKLALAKTQKGLKTDRVIGVFNFNPLLPKISSVINKHFRSMVNENPELKEVFPQPPMAALRQGPNLRKLLCKSKLPKISRNPKRSTHRNSAGWKRCSASGSRACNQCPYTPVSASSITSHVTGYTHHITTPINCNTERVIYAWKCTKCNHNFSVNTKNKTPDNSIHDQTRNEKASNYVGRTTRKFKKRLYEHINYVNIRNLEEPSAEHFCKPGHKVHNLLAIGIEQV